MRLKCGKPPISDYDFLRLFLSLVVSNHQNPVIKNHDLEKELYLYYNHPEYHSLFEDICKKDDITGENNYVVLNRAFLTAYTFGLVKQVDNSSNEIKSFICFSEDQAKKIQSDYEEWQLNAMSTLYTNIFEPKKVNILKKK